MLGFSGHKPKIEGSSMETMGIYHLLMTFTVRHGKSINKWTVDIYFAGKIIYFD